MYTITLCLYDYSTNSALLCFPNDWLYRLFSFKNYLYLLFLHLSPLCQNELSGGERKEALCLWSVYLFTVWNLLLHSLDSAGMACETNETSE